jgi:dTDP-4-dehydrorhamnose reductase/UDP-glucose 4-epimerase
MILIVGRNGFLSKSVARRPDAMNFKFITHKEINDVGVFDGVTSLVNLAVDPRYMALPYQEIFDFELQVGKAIATSDIHYVMLSSRKVYSPEVLMSATEDALAGGIDDYGRSKRTTEKALSEILGPRLTVFRLANVAGFDDQWDRPTFMARMLSGLLSQGRISLDLSPFARRDFITDDAVAEAVIQAAQRRIGGCFNLGSGISLGIGQLAVWIIEGFGRGELLSSDPTIRDEFVLDATKLEEQFGVLCTLDDIKSKCLEAGRGLRGV